ncbi:hypothetical protein Deba_0550 [Desulfarculus baarsii DSM 2075]|uniref:Uncharacterized protein n=1 Tax=Desulfarculus baarsii (strain ATCC 33931 / DSM 2075 / LMG 7858 / VKM B-1802 / 2st14) TaxID=644282 RepID=E1QED6_DESB2|nr:hypothetical protein [Desulfarculus baarsii]ADK83922.1 hypothetical protein Deba_0550 [Desulfarculus baarsii DSM 2075]
MHDQRNHLAQTQTQAPPADGGWLSFNDPCYLRGLLIGAGVALVLGNPAVQKAVVRGAMKLWAGLQYSIEEVKEQIEDVKAEMAVAKQGEQE